MPETTTDRERLVTEHLGFVAALATKLSKTLGWAIEHADLVAYGQKGLLEAASRWDPTVGAAFSTFAYYRIRGAMLDGVRTMGWYSRADHARYEAEERANQLLQNLNDRDTAATQAAGEQSGQDKGAVLEQIADTLSQVAAVHVVSLAAAESVVDESQGSADERLGDAQASARIREAVAALPERERTLMEVYYFQGKSLEEAGAAIGLSKSWASRLHARAVAQLRSALVDD